MNKKKRKPFHEVLAEVLRRKDLRKLSPIAVVRIFAVESIIPKGHDEIDTATREQKQNILPNVDGETITDLCVIQSVVHNEARRVFAETEEKQKQQADKVTDAQKLLALLGLVKDFRKRTGVMIADDKSHVEIDRFCDFVKSIEEAQTSRQLPKAGALLKI